MSTTHRHHARLWRCTGDALIHRLSWSLLYSWGLGFNGRNKYWSNSQTGYHKPWLSAQKATYHMLEDLITTQISRPPFHRQSFEGLIWNTGHTEGRDGWALFVLATLCTCTAPFLWEVWSLNQKSHYLNFRDMGNGQLTVVKRLTQVSELASEGFQLTEVPFHLQFYENTQDFQTNILTFHGFLWVHLKVPFLFTMPRPSMEWLNALFIIMVYLNILQWKSTRIGWC
jgi:hypothetical protein